jgi:Zn-finger nucleic acid-binding protein
MQCPACQLTLLKPVKLEPSLMARKCTHCEGVLIDLLSYRAWRENMPDCELPELMEVEDRKGALICSKCQHFMLKYKICDEHENFIDVCTHCDEAWLDEGEWQLLGALLMQDKLTKIFTEPWQRKIRQDRVEADQRARNQALLGELDYQEAERITQWINDHPKKEDLIRILFHQNH